MTLSKKAVEQFEFIRASGATPNMKDRDNVQRLARMLKSDELAGLTSAEYVRLLKNYEMLLKQHGVERG